MKESAIQSKIIKFLEKKGAYVIRIIKASKAGVHDLAVCFRGKFVTFEVKAERGVVSELQWHHKDKVEGAGGHAFVVHSVAETQQALTLIGEGEG